MQIAPPSDATVSIEKTCRLTMLHVPQLVNRETIFLFIRLSPELGNFPCNTTKFPPEAWSLWQLKGLFQGKWVVSRGRLTSWAFSPWSKGPAAEGGPPALPAGTHWGLGQSRHRHLTLSDWPAVAVTIFFDDHLAREGGPARVEEASPGSFEAGEQCTVHSGTWPTHATSLHVAPHTEEQTYV